MKQYQEKLDEYWKNTHNNGRGIFRTWVDHPGEIRSAYKDHWKSALQYQFDDALKDAPSFEGTVWRGIHAPRGHTAAEMVADAKSNIGQVITWHMPASTSINASEALKFSGIIDSVMYRIDQKTGAVFDSKETEVVTRPGTRYQVMGVRDHVYEQREYDPMTRTFNTTKLRTIPTIYLREV